MARDFEGEDFPLHALPGGLDDEQVLDRSCLPSLLPASRVIERYLRLPFMLSFFGSAPASSSSRGPPVLRSTKATRNPPFRRLFRESRSTRVLR
jgi:hypothetical protein